MAAVWWVARTEFRYRWRSWLALGLLVGVAGGVVLAAIAGGRRTADAFPAYVRSYGYDAYVYSVQPIPKVMTLPEVASAIHYRSPANGVPRCTCRRPITASDFSVFELGPNAFGRFAKLVAGRMPDQSSPNEILASISLEQNFGVHIGSVIRTPFYTAAQASSNGAQTGSLPPRGPTVNMRVVGIAADEDDFPSVGTPNYEVFVTAAFDREVNPRTALFSVYAVRLRHGTTDLPRFDQDATALGAAGEGGQQASSSVGAAIHPQAMGWWLLALLAGVVGAATIAQALSREANVEDDTYRTLAAFGLVPRKLAALGMARTLFIGVTGAIGAVLVAYALSPVAPVGEARIAEPSTGLEFDVFVLGAGAAAVVVAVALLGIWPAIRSSRASQRPDKEQTRRASAVASQLSALGAPPTMVVGLRRALERGHGRHAVPVGTALVGTVLAVAALCCTTVFGASLSHLTSTPSLYGQPFRFWLNNFGTGPEGTSPFVSALKAQPSVTAITLGTSGSVTVNGVSTDAIAGQSLRGAMLVSAVNGRVPLAHDEVALGVKTMRQAHAQVGSTVRVVVPLANGGMARSQFRVVGTASFPPDFGVVGLSNGIVFTVAGYLDALCPPGPARSACEKAKSDALAYVLLVGTTPGAAGGALEAHYVKTYPDVAIAPVTPENLVNFGQAVDFPLILGLILLLFGAATLVHMLVVSVARRRRELALLKALGFVRYQATATVCWQATTFALIGVVIGVPLGIAAGHLAWVAFATNLGVVPEPVVPALAVALLAVGVLVVANLLAIGPGLLSARAQSSLALRAD